jgi:hypothetical protein
MSAPQGHDHHRTAASLARLFAVLVEIAKSPPPPKQPETPTAPKKVG